ncbi:MAG TPA: hypothetical protein VHF69_12755 [Candidatus Synoicihabitans sp.]|nr:hypothetical protein [Candidatus Synoicihabitans sp.]
MSLRMGIPHPLMPLANLLETLAALAVEHAARAAKRQTGLNRARRGATLRPGLETPLWNAVVDRVRLHLRRRGAKANLARLLAVPRQRVHDYFVGQSQMPDAERLIHLLLWLNAREGAKPRVAPKPLR